MTYHVIREDGAKVEGLTKEQIYELINGTTGEIPEGVDEAFITKLKELNEGGNVSIWVGTNAEYNAIEVKNENTLYVIVDDTFYEDTSDAITDIKNRNEAMNSRLSQMNEEMEALKASFDAQMAEYKDWIEFVEENI